MSDVIEVFYPTCNCCWLSSPWHHTSNPSGSFLFYFSLYFGCCRLSIAGNRFLCSALTTQICGGVPKPVNGIVEILPELVIILRLMFLIKLYFYHAETSSDKRISNHHRWVVSVSVGVSCTFIVTVMLLVCWVHWYRSRVLTGYGNYKIRNTSPISCTLRLDTLWVSDHLICSATRLWVRHWPPEEIFISWTANCHRKFQL